MTSSPTYRRRPGRRARPCLAALSLALLLAPAGALAQDTVVIGGRGGGGADVQVDMQALGGGPGPGGRRLAPVYGLDDRGLRIPGEQRRAAGPIQLRPPDGAEPAVTARAPSASAPAPRTALQPPPTPPLVAPPAPQAAPRPAAPAAPAVNLPSTTPAPAPAAPTPPPPVPSAAAPAPAPSATTPPPAPPQVARTAPDTPRTPAPAARAAPTPVAPPPPAPVAAPAQPDTSKTAMAAPPVGFGGTLALGFVPGSASLTREAEQQLDRLAAALRDTDDRLQLKAFASADDDNTSRARRTSLSRALAARSYLIEAGIRSTRIDVRALGVARDGGAEDRVDVIVLGQ